MTPRPSPRPSALRQTARFVLASVVAFTALAAAAPAATAQQVSATRAAPTPEDRGWLGLSLREVAVPPGVPGAVNGVRLVVTDLFRGGPAQRSGLQPGDVLVRLNGAPAEIHRFRSVAARLLPGDPMSLTVLRGSRMVDLSVEAGAAPQREDLVRQVVQVHLDSARIALAPRLDSLHARLRSLEVHAGVLGLAPRVEVERVQGDSLHTFVVLTRADGSTVQLDQPRTVFGTLTLTGPVAVESGSERVFRFQTHTGDSVPVRTVAPARPPEATWRPLAPYVTGANRVAGAELQSVDPALGSYFGVARGVLVLSLAEGTPAQRAGLQPGDVIVEAGGRAVAGVEEVRTILARTSSPVPLQVVRKGRIVGLTLPR